MTVYSKAEGHQLLAYKHYEKMVSPKKTVLYCHYRKGDTRSFPPPHPPFFLNPQAIRELMPGAAGCFYR